MRVGFLMTARCNAQCLHCSTSCGPRRSEALAQEEIICVMEQATALAGDRPTEFYLSGGEPFLKFDLLLNVVRHARRLGATVTCVTNGYWATSPERARSRLAQILEAGINAIALSTSRYHQEFVKRSRVEHALNAAREIGLHCTLKYARTRSDPWSSDEVKAWARAAGASDVDDFAVLPYLSGGRDLPEAEYSRDPGLPEGRCPSALITIRQDGEAFTCGANGALNSVLALGNIKRETLESVRTRFYMGGAQQLLRELGPAHFARAVVAKGQGHRLRTAYHGVCDLCAHLSSDPVMAEVVSECAEAREREQIEHLLGDGPAPDSSSPALR